MSGPATPSRFEALPGWQRAGLLTITTLAACLVLLLIAEAAARIRNHAKFGFWGVEETFTIDKTSGLRIPVPNGHFGAIRINSFGFRSPEITQKKPSGRLRIAFLGGSTTYCAEVSRNEMTWPYLVWRKFRQHWPELDVDYINAGVPGYTIRSLLPALEKRVAAFKPDIIVIYEATNDLSANSYELAREQGSAPPRSEVGRGWLARHSLLVDLVEKNLEIIHREQSATNSSGKLKLDFERLDAEFRRDYTNLVTASGKIAEVVAAVTFSSRLRAAQTPDERLKAAVTSLYYMPYMTVDQILAGFIHYNEVIRQVATAHGALLIGGADTIPADARHYTDSVHFTDAGSVVMADRVARALISSPSVQKLVADTLRRAQAGARPPA